MTSISTAGFGIKSIQRGVTTVGTFTYVDVTITSVNTSKSTFTAIALSGYGRSTAVTGIGCASLGGGYLQAATNVQINGGRPSYTQPTENTVVYWEVVEYA